MKEEPRTPNAKIGDHLKRGDGTKEAKINEQGVTYTSLKDVLPASMGSPESSTKSASIRNPLVKQAALAYLQPVVGSMAVGDKGLIGKFSDACGEGEDCQCGCLGWLNGVVLSVRTSLLGKRGGRVGEAEDEEEDEDGKVD